MIPHVIIAIVLSLLTVSRDGQGKMPLVAESVYDEFYVENRNTSLSRWTYGIDDDYQANNGDRTGRKIFQPWDVVALLKDDRLKTHQNHDVQWKISPHDEGNIYRITRLPEIGRELVPEVLWCATKSVMMSCLFESMSVGDAYVYTSSDITKNLGTLRSVQNSSNSRPGDKEFRYPYATRIWDKAMSSGMSMCLFSDYDVQSKQYITAKSFPLGVKSSVAVTQPNATGKSNIYSLSSQSSDKPMGQIFTVLEYVTKNTVISYLAEPMAFGGGYDAKGWKNLMVAWGKAIPIWEAIYLLSELPIDKRHTQLYGVQSQQYMVAKSFPLWVKSNTVTTPPNVTGISSIQQSSSIPASNKSAEQTPGLSSAKVQPQAEQVFIRAKRLVSNSDKKSVVANGNVEIQQQTNRILADQITYLQGEKRFIAHQPVQFFNTSQGLVIFAERADFLDDLSCGSFGEADLYFANGSLLKTADLQQLPSQVIKAKKVRYYLCPSDQRFDLQSKTKVAQPTGPSKSIFSLHANSALLDNNTDKIKLQNVIFYWKKVPIFYLPFVTIPKPGGKKRNGFYGLSYISGGKIGGGLELEYRFYDRRQIPLIVSPTIYFNGALRLDSSYKRNLAKVREEYQDYFQLQALVATDNGQLTQEQNLDKRKTLLLRLQGQKFLNHDWSLDYHTFVLSNKRYLYNFEGNDDNYLPFETHLRYTQDNGKSYGSLGGIVYRELYEHSSHLSMPIVLPFTWHWEKNLWHGAKNNIYTSLDTSLSAVERLEGNLMRLANAEPAIFWLHRGRFGHITINPTLQLQWLNYDYRQPHNVGRADPSQDSESVKRILGKASIDWRLPLRTAFNRGGSILFEPRVKLVSNNMFHRTLSASDLDIVQRRNESSRAKELQTSSVFSDDLFSGYDLAESGARVSYGVRLVLQRQGLGQLDFELAQLSVLQDKDGLYRQYFFIDEHSSSPLLGRLSYTSSQGLFNLDYQFTLDHESGRALAQEMIGSWYLRENLSFYLGYGNFHRDLLQLDLDHKYVRNTINAGMNYGINQRFRINLDYTWDMEEKRLENQNINLTYKHPCIEIVGKFYVDYVEKRELALGRKNTRGFSIEARIKNSFF